MAYFGTMAGPLDRHKKQIACSKLRMFSILAARICLLRPFSVAMFFSRTTVAVILWTSRKRLDSTWSHTPLEPCSSTTTMTAEWISLLRICTPT